MTWWIGARVLLLFVVYATLYTECHGSRENLIGSISGQVELVALEAMDDHDMLVVGNFAGPLSLPPALSSTHPISVTPSQSNQPVTSGFIVRLSESNGTIYTRWVATVTAKYYADDVQWSAFEIQENGQYALAVLYSPVSSISLFSAEGDSQDYSIVVGTLGEIAILIDLSHGVYTQYTAIPRAPCERALQCRPVAHTPRQVGMDKQHALLGYWTEDILENLLFYHVALLRLVPFDTSQIQATETLQGEWGMKGT